MIVSMFARVGCGSLSSGGFDCVMK